MFVNFVVLFSFLFLFLFSLKVERVKRKQQTEFRQITHRDWNAKLIVNFFIFCMDSNKHLWLTHTYTYSTYTGLRRRLTLVIVNKDYIGVFFFFFTFKMRKDYCRFAILKAVISALLIIDSYFLIGMKENFRR